MNTLTTLEMRNELGKIGVTIHREQGVCLFDDEYGSAFIVMHNGVEVDVGHDIVALTRFTYRINLYK